MAIGLATNHIVTVYNSGRSIDNDLNLISLPGSPLIVDDLFIQALKRVDWSVYDFVVSDVYLTNMWGAKGILRLHESALFMYLTWLNKNKRDRECKILEEAREIAPVNRDEYRLIASYQTVVCHDINLLNTVYKTSVKQLPYIVDDRYDYVKDLLLTDCSLVQENAVDDCLYVAKLLKLSIVICGTGPWLPNLRAIAKAHKIDAYFMDYYNQCSAYLDMSLKFNNYNSNVLKAAMSNIQTITTNDSLGFTYIDIGDVDKVCDYIRNRSHTHDVDHYATDTLQSTHSTESVIKVFETTCLGV